MHLADYQTPTVKHRTKQTKTEEVFVADENRLCVIIRSEGGKTQIKFGSCDFASMVVDANTDKQLPQMYIGVFTVVPDAKATVVVTEILRHNA
jgi:hypothetical protein